MGGKSLTPAVPKCTASPFTCYAAKGFVKMLDRKFDEPFWPQSFDRLLARSDYQVPDKFWNELNRLSCKEIDEIIYGIVAHVHMCEALYAVKWGTEENPLGSLKGDEHLALPLPLAGEARFKSLLLELAPTLKRFGLDKTMTLGKNGGMVYQSAINLFFSKWHDFYRIYRLESSYYDLYLFIGNIRAKLDDWPEVLDDLFRTEDEIMTAINQVAMHY